MNLVKQPTLMNDDGSETYQGLLDRLDPTSLSYDKDLKKRLKNRPVSNREKKLMHYLTANNMGTNRRPDPTFITNTGGRSDTSLMGRDHTRATGRSLPDLNVSEVTPNAATDSATRYEEDLHSLQKRSLFDWNKLLSSNKTRRNKRDLKKELKNADFTPEEYERRVEDNYALSGAGSALEFEAKMIATKMMLLEQGVIDSADEVITEEKLNKIIQWKKNQYKDSSTQSHDFTTVLYSHDSPKMRELLLKTLNDL